MNDACLYCVGSGRGLRQSRDCVMTHRPTTVNISVTVTQFIAVNPYIIETPPHEISGEKRSKCDKRLSVQL
jgi:hypothetical protein